MRRGLFRASFLFFTEPNFIGFILRISVSDGFAACTISEKYSLGVVCGFFVLCAYTLDIATELHV